MIGPVRDVRRRRTLLALGLVASAFGLGACGGGSSKHPVRHHPSAPRSRPSHVASAPAGTVNALVALDTQTTVGRLTRYRVSIHDLRRDGQFLTLDFALTCLSHACSPAVDLAQRVPGDPSVSRGTASAVSLIDPAAGLQYGVVRDQRDRAYASALPSTMTAGQTLQAWLNYPSPPATVTSLDVVIGNGGSWIHRIPIAASGGAPAPATWGGSVTRAHAAPFAFLSSGGRPPRLREPVLEVESTSGNSSGTDQETGRAQTLTLSSDALFRPGKALLTSAAHAIIKAVAGRIARRAVGPVTVTGYTDAVGSEPVNIALSREHAASVVAALQSLAPSHHARYLTRGLGSSDPVAPNTTPSGADNRAGRRLNRRVTISFAVRRPARTSRPPAVSSSPVPSSGGPAVVYRYRPAGAGGRGAESYRVGGARLLRVGRYVVLSLVLTCEAAPQRAASCSASDAFAAGSSAGAVPPEPETIGSTPGGAPGSAAAIYLQDPADGTLYVANRNAVNVPLGTTLEAQIPRGASLPVWEAFPAPSASTSELDVILPGGHAAIYSVAVRPARRYAVSP
jgi:outer membrane protein OmpA-like peptidoglycan-associated protein